MKCHWGEAGPGTRFAGAGNRAKLCWAAALGGNLALLGVYLQSLNTSAWLSRVLSPAVGFRVERVSWMVNSGSGLLIVAVGVLLLAVSILAMAEVGTRPTAG